MKIKANFYPKRKLFYNFGCAYTYLAQMNERTNKLQSYNMNKKHPIALPLMYNSEQKKNESHAL
ncbi:CLUMA_CG005185, isoform A [Clunio marinus]|uniref:CLUMA_CG005185, isoform A n=1 Tax=Clunio marinus TaxID=568069 RepID=A0A1J1HVY5_9DIPT|nr:CLUMA_CG005185, isoform A [Clunio marinus]